MAAHWRRVVPHRGPTVLLYHRVEPRPRRGDPWSVSVANFASQMRELRLTGRRVTRLADLQSRDDGVADQSVVLAFDDGYHSAFEHAVPILSEAGFAAAFFLVPRAMGSDSAWESAADVVPSRLMTWNEARELAQAGYDIGSHSLTHADLTNADATALDDEVRGSRVLLQDRLGVNVSAFSVPFGRDDRRLNHALLRSGYDLKVTNSEAARARIGDLRVQPCIAIEQSDSVHDFRDKVIGAYDWLYTLRRWRKRR